MILSAEEAFHIFNDSIQVNRSWDGKSDVQRFTFHAPEAGYAHGQYTIPLSYPEFGGKQIQLHQNFGFMVLIDPDSAQAVHKLYHAGRFSHESAVALPDNRTLILTDDFEPAVLFKFVADEPGNFLRGNLYAFQQRPGEHVGRWFQIPRVLDSLLDARNVAIRMGATLFMRHEWAALDPATGNVYISETGVDRFELGPQHAPAGLPPNVAQHIRALPNAYEPSMGFMAYPFGALLVLENPLGMDSTVVRPLLEGGPSVSRGYHVANFDGLSMGQVGLRRWLVVQEDLIGRSQGRMPEGSKHEVCEAFLLDLSIPDPTIDDLHRIFASSQGAELTGGILLADGTLLINNQHPKAAPVNQPPYDRCATVALHGLGADLMRLPPPSYHQPESPNAQPLFAAHALGAVYFDAPTTAELHNAAGEVVRQVRNRDFISVAGLPRGTYQLHLATQAKPFSVMVE
jgi:secreted PhoX family phosphatase